MATFRLCSKTTAISSHFFPAMINSEASHQNVRQMPTDGVDLLEFRVGFLEHRKLDVADRSSQIQLITNFLGVWNRMI